MNRTDRLLAIVLELQGQGGAQATDLAHRFEVSARTIYRDVLALNETGVPIISVPGQGYTLMPGYFLPPLRLNVEEAVMLMLGSDVMAQTFDPDLARGAESAARKIGAVLGEEVRREVQFLRANLRLVQRDPGADATLLKVRTVRQAIVRRRRLAFAYHKPHAPAAPRAAEPHGLFRLNAVWMLAAFDAAHSEMRTFRLDRMDDLTVLDEPFERRPDFTLARDEARERRELTVRVRFRPEVARQVQENLSYYATQAHDTPEGLTVTLQVRAAADVVPWLLSWGAAAQVLEPVSVRRQLNEEALKVVRLYS